jgi:L-asparaginase/Glu-tRNA(Gln) amidotransferase subunit D
MKGHSILPLFALGVSLLGAPGSAQQPEQLPRVHILATGGTIASVYVRSGRPRWPTPTVPATSSMPFAWPFLPKQWAWARW